MSDPKNSDELTELEPLPDDSLDDLEPLPDPGPAKAAELAPLEELEPLEEAPAAKKPAAASGKKPAVKSSRSRGKPAVSKAGGGKSAAGKATAAKSAGDGSKAPRPKREKQSAEDAEAAALAASEAVAELQRLRGEDKAPEHLKKASVIVAVGCVLPWLMTNGHIGIQLGAKALIIAGAYVFHMCVLHRAGEKIDKTFRGLAEKTFVDVNAKPKNALQSMLHSVPSTLHVLGWVLTIGGLVAAWFIGSPAYVGLAGVSMLAWATATFVHIDSYERGGSFNPIFPLMFLGHAIAGVLTIVKQIAGGMDTKGMIAIVGAAIVTVGGIFAMYTIVESMKQAKVEGDLKKKAKSEARKAERKARAK